MEDKNHARNDKSALQSDFVKQTLKSWRFFLLFSMPPLVWVIFAAPPSLPRNLIALLCGLAWLGCWRLWLDERYFRFITENNNKVAGEILFTLWKREKLQELTLAERQSGALRQCHYTLLLTTAVWVVWLIAM